MWLYNKIYRKYNISNMTYNYKNDLKRKINQTFVIIPVYNESKTLIKVIKNLKKKFRNIVCVDDGSNDNIYYEIEKEKIFYLRHEINLGQGAALQTGINFAKKKGGNYFITFDGDGQHKVKDAYNMTRLIVKNNFDIILGSRFEKKNNSIPWSRKIILKIGIIITRLLSNLKITDVHNGLRVFNLKFANKLKIVENRMSHPSDFLENITKNNFKYSEYPTNIIYSKYSIAKGQKNINSLNIFFDMIIRFLK